mgnify:FL=1
MTKRKLLLFLPAILVLVYVAGPKPEKPDFHQVLPDLPEAPAEVEDWLQQREAALPVKADNQAHIVWARDSLPQKTEYVVLYLHGFGASRREGAPAHLHLARQLQANLLLGRLEGHGLRDTLPLQNFNAQNYYDSALEHYALAKKLGRKVVIMGSSTGGTLALLLAAGFPEVEALVLLSPNIRIKDPMATLLNKPWGYQLGRLATGSEVMSSQHPADWYPLYWYPRYSLRAVVEMQQLLATGMRPKVFARVKQPLLLLYYYRNEVEQDPVVQVDAMLRMFRQVGTPAKHKWALALPEAGDHVVGCDLRSGALPQVEEALNNFSLELKDL